MSLQRKIGTRWVTVRSVKVVSTKGRWAVAWKAEGSRSYWRVRISAHGVVVGYSRSRLVVVT